MKEKHIHYHYHLDNVDQPLVVKLTEEDVNRINLSKAITLVPGDLVTVAAPIETSQLDCSTYSSMNAIMHVKNTGSVRIEFTARATQGPIGDIQEVELTDYNRSLGPGQEFVWYYTKAIFATYFKAYFSITEDGPGGEADVNHSVVLSKGNVV